ncbi:DUF2927 domain-containing protein [Profundibacter sp.]
MTRLHRLFAAFLSVSLIGLAGCDVPLPPTTPVPRPEAPRPKAAPQSEVSRQMSKHLARVQADLLVQGLLRVDGGGPDVPFLQRNLVDNFIRIAMFDEYTNTGGQIIARETESRLRRWEQPIRMKVEFGPSVPLAQRAKDRAEIARYIQRLSRLTGVPIRLTTGAANYNVLILNEDERRAAAPRLQKLAPGIGTASLNAVTNMSRSTLCLVFAYSDSTAKSTYAKAVAVIRGEHPDLLRLSCIHEELAQGMGLANDSPAARPSIFNDDEEFGLLTRHDELLLQMLYDRRLRAGMTAREARPIAKIIAAELLGGTS